MDTYNHSQYEPPKKLAINNVFKPVVIAPTYNNDSTLPNLLKQLDALGMRVIVVNDGSCDKTESILKNWANQSEENLLITHLENQGKAAALRSGFALAEKRGFTHALTIDTDGQHDPKDSLALLKAGSTNPDAFVLGTRAEKITGCPWTSRAGRWISNKLIAIESGLQVTDSQSGFRVYPLKIVKQLSARTHHTPHTQRYAFESEILTRLGWAQLEVIQVPIDCKYNIDGEKRISHFKVWRDSISSARMHLGLLTAALFPGKFINPKQITPKCKNLKTGTIFSRTLRWLNPFRLIREIRAQSTARNRLATSFGAGAFMAPLPLYGVKTVTCLAVAKIFKLEPLAVLGGCSLSTPPVGIVLVVISIAIGNMVLTGNIPDLSQYDIQNIEFTKVVWHVLLQWAIGRIILGALLGGLTFGLISAIGKLFPIKPSSVPNED